MNHLAFLLYIVCPSKRKPESVKAGFCLGNAPWYVSDPCFRVKLATQVRKGGDPFWP